jgi:hypothetical protein
VYDTRTTETVARTTANVVPRRSVGKPVVNVSTCGKLSLRKRPEIKTKIGTQIACLRVSLLFNCAKIRHHPLQAKAKESLTIYRSMIWAAFSAPNRQRNVRVTLRLGLWKIRKAIEKSKIIRMTLTKDLPLLNKYLITS